ncbi:MAG: hypothetical protein VX346_15495 [Planctomycetota bacterium]|nr:hypothetical protein [Planctomycetota bacterium]
MKSWLSLMLLVALWAVVLHLLLTPEIVGQPAAADHGASRAGAAASQQGTQTASSSVAAGHGVPHPDARFLEMNQGGSGQQRHAAVLLGGWVFGALQIALFTGLLAWSAGLPTAAQVQTTDSRESHPWVLWGLFLFGGLLFEGVFALLCRSYQVSLLDPANTRFLGSFPEATTWLLFGIWFAPGVFVALYVLFFDRWIFSSQSEARFAALLAARTATLENSAEEA